MCVLHDVFRPFRAKASYIYIVNKNRTHLQPRINLLPDFIPGEPGHKSLILIITKCEQYKKKDHAINSKIPKFGIKRMNS